MNFLTFLQVVNAMAPLVAETVEALHPGNVTEATKINTGVQLLNIVTATAAQVATSTAPAPVATVGQITASGAVSAPVPDATPVAAGNI